MNLQLIHRDDLPLGGFAGLKEHRLVIDKNIGGDDGVWNGIGNFVYLADARFLPKGETYLHPHHEIDVITIVVDGRLTHEGSLEHGRSMVANQAQVQRAGGEGFEHNEINPDDDRNRIIQIWVLPEKKGESVAYKFYDIEKGKLTRIYGGRKNQGATLDSHTNLDVGVLNKGQKINKEGVFMAYITRGSGDLDGTIVKDGDLVRGVGLKFTAALDDVQIIIITVNDRHFQSEEKPLWEGKHNEQSV